MVMEKYGVEDRRELLEAELEAVRQKLVSPDLTKWASVKQVDFLIQREKDILDMLMQLESEEN